MFAGAMNRGAGCWPWIFRRETLRTPNDYLITINSIIASKSSKIIQKYLHTEDHKQFRISCEFLYDGSLLGPLADVLDVPIKQIYPYMLLLNCVEFSKGCFRSVVSYSALSFYYLVWPEYL
jgi:hypothetical protein